MSDADDYESLPESTPLYITCLAGATAGVAEHCIMYPLDSVKTRMQSLCCQKQHNRIGLVFMTMVREEGIFRPIKGMSAMAAGAGPAHAMYFTAVEKTRDFLTARNVSEHLASGASAVFATMLHDAVMTPAEVVKQRMQMCCSPFKTCSQATMTIFRTEGIKAFYRSYFTQLTMNVPFQAAVVSSYSICQSFLNPSREYNPGVHFVAGAIAGGIGSAVTMPLDVCKTLLNTQETAVLKSINLQKVEGLYGAALVVNRMTGLSGFFQGLSARVLYQAPSTAVSWSCYEFFKYYLKSREAGAGNEIEGTIADLETAKSSYGKREDVSFEALPQIPELRSPKIPTVMASNTYQK